MAEDLNLNELAAYLHLDLTLVRRMAERGKIPGRRKNGDWKFHEAEIHHWLEERILECDAVEAKRLEGVLEKARHPAATEDTSVEALLPVEAIAVPLAAKTKSSVVDAMCDLAANTGNLWDPGRMAEAVRQREEMFPTAVEGGLALLHPRRPMESILGQPFLAFGRTGRGIPFGDPGGGLTDLFFLILSTDDGGHLRTLARLGRILGAPGTLDELREVEDPVAVRSLLVAKERELAP